MTTAQDTTPAGTRPSGPGGERVMRCSRCDGEWKTPAARPEAPVACPFCNVHVCACGCGEDMSYRRSNSLYATETHSRRIRRALDPANPDATRTGVRTVADARAIQEDAKGHWSAIVREGICEVLARTGYFHADDLAHLGIPDEHRNIIGSQTAKLVNQKWMTKVGERKSISPGRNAAKSGIYQLTALGRRKLAGAGTREEKQGEGTAGPAAAGHRNETAPSTGPGAAACAIPSGAPDSSGADSGEPARLFGEDPPDRRPRFADIDQEWAA